MIIPVNKLSSLKVEFGNVDQIQTVRHYNDLRLGLKPVVEGSKAWDSNPDAECFDLDYHPHASFNCPECFHKHVVWTDKDTGEFLNDSNFCTYCQTEFVFHDDSEFKLYVNPEQQ